MAMTQVIAADLQQRRSQISTVQCGSCRACCKGDPIALAVGDDPQQYQWHSEPFRGRVARVLDRKANGECIYLTEQGCSIHGRAPLICRQFHCGVLFAMTPREARSRNIVERPLLAFVYAAGSQRLESLRRG